MSLFKSIAVEAVNENMIKLIGKDWMLVTAKSEDKINTMTASWGGLGVMWGKPVAFVAIRPSRYTNEFIEREENFSLSFFPQSYRKTLNYLGTVSGRDEDKIKNSKLTLIDEDVPYFEEAKLVLKVKKLYKQRLSRSSFVDPSLADRWYPSDDCHYLYIAEITEALTK